MMQRQRRSRPCLAAMRFSDEPEAASSGGRLDTTNDTMESVAYVPAQSPL